MWSSLEAPGAPPPIDGDELFGGTAELDRLPSSVLQEAPSFVYYNPKLLQDAISDQHTWKEVDQGSMARGDHPTIARRHCSLERDCHTMLQHVTARSRHGTHRTTLHETMLELPY